MRIVHYVNQFFGQIGGEDKANHPLEVVKGAVGPGMQLKKILEDDGEIVATIICGDNYFAENAEKLTEQIVSIMKEYKAELLVAGPAFTAGRYGLACGSVCKIIHQSIGIPTVSGMHEENPGLDMFRKYAYIFPTERSARGMKGAVDTLASFIKKISRGEKIGSPETEGYFSRGIRVPVFREEIGGKRAVNMILDKLNGREYKTELDMPKFTKFAPSAAVKDIKKATIALMTSGGMVPSGNPDHLESCFCTKYKYYSVDDFGGPGIPNTEVCHGGFDPTFANEDANRVLPVDGMLELEKNGEIGKFYPKIYVTSGNAMAADQAATFGDAIAKELLSEGIVDGIILTSTWGTDTRCGATLAKQIDSAGIPTVHISTITPISYSVGANRLVPGVSIPYPTGNPMVSSEEEKEVTMGILRKALEALETEISEQTIFSVNK